MVDSRVEKLARLCVHYCVAVKPKEKVVNAIELCKQHRAKHKVRMFSKCWGCLRLSKEEPSKMCFNNPPENRGCKFINELFDESKSTSPTHAFSQFQPGNSGKQQTGANLGCSRVERKGKRRRHHNKNGDAENANQNMR